MKIECPSCQYYIEIIMGMFEWNFFIRYLYNPHRNGQRISHPECRKILTLLNAS